MTAMASIDPTRLLGEQLAQASSDLLRKLLTTFVNTLMLAEADAVCGAAYGTSASTPQRLPGPRVRHLIGLGHRYATRPATVFRTGAHVIGFIDDQLVRDLVIDRIRRYQHKQR